MEQLGFYHYSFFSIVIDAKVDHPESHFKSSKDNLNLVKMKWIKLIGLGLVLSSLVMFSCTKETEELENVSTELRKSKYPKIPSGVTTTPQGWLKFVDENSYNETRAYLLDIMHTGVTGNAVYDPNVDPYPGLAEFEDIMDINTLRKKMVEDENTGLGNRLDPVYVINNLKDHKITSPISQTINSNEYVHQVGNDIFIRPQPGIGVCVKNNNIPLVNEIVNNGLGSLANSGASINDVVVGFWPQGSLMGPFECKADFTYLEGSKDCDDNEIIVTFTWNGGDLSQVSDFEATWDFGDGTSKTVLVPTTSHKFEVNPFPSDNLFNVSLTVSYRYYDDNNDIQDCNMSYTEPITLACDQTAGDLCNELDGLLLIAELTNEELVTWTTLSSNIVQFDASFLIGLFSALTDLDWEWTFPWMNQTSTEISPVFNYPCENTYSVNLTFTNNGEFCASYDFDAEINENGNCQGFNDITMQEEDEYFKHNKESKVVYRGKHQTKLDNIPFFHGGNQIEAEQKSYKRNFLGGWSRVDRDHTINMNGKVISHGNGCACGGPEDFLDEEIIEIDVCRTYHEKVMFANSDGIFCDPSDPYTISFKEGNVDEEESFDFPQ